MKKILCLILAAVFCLSLASCKFSDPVDRTKVDKEETTAEQETNAPVKDYDENGDFILTSADNRAVFKMDGGSYAVFKFNGEAVYEIYNVIEFENAEKTQEYVVENTVAAMESGLYNNMQVEDNLVIYTCSVSEKGLGRYYSYTKTAVLEEFKKMGNN